MCIQSVKIRAFTIQMTRRGCSRTSRWRNEIRRRQSRRNCCEHHRRLWTASGPSGQPRAMGLGRCSLASLQSTSVRGANSGESLNPHSTNSREVGGGDIEILASDEGNVQEGNVANQPHLNSLSCSSVSRPSVNEAPISCDVSVRGQDISSPLEVLGPSTSVSILQTMRGIAPTCSDSSDDKNIILEEAGGVLDEYHLRSDHQDGRVWSEESTSSGEETTVGGEFTRACIFKGSAMDDSAETSDDSECSALVFRLEPDPAGDGEGQGDPDDPGYPDEQVHVGDHDDQSNYEDEEEIDNDENPVHNIQFLNNDDDNGGDPDDPGYPHSDSDESMADEEPNFSLDNPDLNMVCRSINNCSTREVLALLLAVSVRDRLTYEALIRLLKVFNGVFGRQYLPTNKQQLWHYLGRTELGITKYVYCKDCLALHGKLADLHGERNCDCGAVVKPKRAKYFITLNVKKQLCQLLRLREVREALTYRQQRQLRLQNTMEDILDGSQYKLLREDPNILGVETNYSYTFNLDGFRLTKSSTLEAWPIFLRWNELPPKIRQKHILLAGIWVDLKKPKMNLFLERFVTQANSLSNEGVPWRTTDGQEINSKFFPTCFVADAQARCAVLNLNAPTGYNACVMCNHAGLYVGGCVHYPILPPVPHFERRTDAEIKECMVEANAHPQEAVLGFKGPSQLMICDHMDLGKNIVTDDIHPFGGVIEHHTTILFTRTREEEPPPYYIGRPDQIARINARLLGIRTPTHISRKPRPITTRGRWKSSEWRNWLLYYLVPCLEGILNQRYLGHIELLAQALFLLSRDIVSEADCAEAQRLLTQYAEQFERFFGREKMLFNIHVILHSPDCVREWGPLFAQSTSVFETWNHTLMQTATSPNAPADQIVTRLLIKNFLDHVEDSDQVSRRVKDQVNTLLHDAGLLHAVRIDDVLLLGKATTRAPNDRERELLQEVGIVCEHFTVYQRAKVERGEFRTARYRYGGEEIRSDNSYVLTWDDEFARIMDIVVVHGEERRVFLFLSVLNTPVNRNPYISRVAAGVEIISIARFQDLRSHAILCNTPAGGFIMPVTNTCEID